MEFNEDIHKLVLKSVKHKVSAIHHEDRRVTIIDYLHEDNLEAIKHFGSNAVSNDVVTPAEGTARDTCGDGTATFVLDNPIIKWGKLPVSYAVNPTNSKLDSTITTGAVIDAFQTFNDEQNAIVFNRTVDLNVAQISIQFMPIDGSGGTVGYCDYTWDGSHNITSAQIVLDSYDIWYVSPIERCGFFGNAMDIQNVMTHEIGHALGLAHNTDTLSTMYPNVMTGETLRRTLSQGDRQGFHVLYGPTKPTYPVESTYGPIILNGAYNTPYQIINVISVGNVAFRTAFLDLVKTFGYGITRASWYLHYNTSTKTWTKVAVPPN